MEAKDLRIGSWVNYKTENIAQEICSIQSDNTIRLKDSKGTNHGCYRMSYIDPIPLTDEWLIKLGFDDNFHKGKFWVCLDDNGYFYTNHNLNDEGFTEVLHIHQLQNLYFALTGEELEIKQKD